MKEKSGKGRVDYSLYALIYNYSGLKTTNKEDMNATVWSPAVPGKRSTVKPGFPLSANFVRAKNRKIMLRGEGGGGGEGGMETG